MQHMCNNNSSSSSSNNNNMTLIDWTHQLQEWRRHAVPPVSFQDWPTEKKNEFRSFVREFGSISINASSDVSSRNSSSSSSCMRSFGMSSSSSSIWMDNKRDYEDDDLLQILLEHPPVNQVESNAFWNALQTKQGATKLYNNSNNNGHQRNK